MERENESNEEPGWSVLKPPLTVVIFGAAVGAQALLAWLLPLGRIAPEPLYWLTGVLMVLAAIPALWAAGLFLRAGTPVHPFRTPRKFVAEGPYRVTRNPMCLGMLIAVLAVVPALNAWSPLLVVPVFIAVMQRAVIQWEEKRLEELYGEEFNAYKRKVPRWLFF
jgi:protein-S-isoprenylcysteine O-methyltransferase Ste14